MNKSPKTLFEKIWSSHIVEENSSDDEALIYIDRHLIHEVTSPQAFGMIREKGMEVSYPELTHATVDHIIPTLDQSRPFKDDQTK